MLSAWAPTKKSVMIRSRLGAPANPTEASHMSYGYAEVYFWSDAGMDWATGDTIEFRLFNTD